VIERGLQGVSSRRCALESLLTPLERGDHHITEEHLVDAIRRNTPTPSLDPPSFVVPSIVKDGGPDR